MIFTESLNTIDKVRSLSIFLGEINDLDILNISNDDLKINHLRSVCFDIDRYINIAIEFAKTNYLTEERIILLIQHAEKLKNKQNIFENELTKLGSPRNLEQEYEINSAFDFELEPKLEIKLLPNAIEIERRIRDSITKNNSDVNSNKNSYSKKPFPFYCEIGALFAQGFINRVVDKNRGYLFFYKDCSFEKIEHLSKYIKKDILNAEKEVRQYISSTLNKKGEKNFYSSEKKMNKILEFCKTNNYTVTIEFNKKYKNLIDERNAP